MICVNENNNIPYLLEAINKKLCPTLYCGDDWKLHQKKIINGICVEDSEPIETTIIIKPETTSRIKNELTENIVTEKIKETSHLNFITTNSITLTTQLPKDNTDTTYNKNKPPFGTTIYETTLLDDKNIVSENILPTLNKIKDHETYQIPLINKSEDIHKSEILTFPSIVFNEMENILKEIKIDYFNNSNYTSEEINQKIYEQIINNIIKNMDTLSEEGIVIEAEDNFFFQITTLENDNERKNNASKIFSRIDFGECENILKENYNLNENVSLIILKYEKLSNISSERSLQYEIYEPINKNRLNLSLCNDIPIDIYVPLVLSDKLKNLYEELKNLGYDLFDINDDFYQDICTPYRTSNGTDILLSDRINDYYNNDETQCQPNCQFSDYSMETQDLKCECNIISSEIKVEKVEDFSSKSLYKSFYDVLKFSNYKVLKCFKLVFKINIFNTNIGNYIALAYFSIFFVIFLIYLIRGRTELKNELVNNLIDKGANNINIFSERINLKIEKGNSNDDSRRKMESKELSKNMKYPNFNTKTINIEKKDKINKFKTNNNDVHKKLHLRRDNNKKNVKPRLVFNFPPKKIIIKTKNNNIYKQKNLITNKLNSKNVLEQSKKEFEEIRNIEKKIRFDISEQIYNSVNNEKLDSYEINNLDYTMAIKLDHRKFFEIYWSILKREHSIIFTFFMRNDHNIIYIKYSRFIFFVCTDMALNVFFFSDETMHKMYIDYGKYNFVQQIPQIIYSTIVSQMI